MAVCAQSKLNYLNPWFQNSTGSTIANVGLNPRRRGASRNREHVMMVKMASSSSSSSSTGGSIAKGTMEFEEGKLERPRWTGETPLSRLVGALISFKPLYSVMKFGARQALISTAEKTNIPWREMTRRILDSDVYKEFESIRDPSLAAAEAEAATMSMIRRAIPYASSLDEANQIVRGNWLEAIEKHHQKYSQDNVIRDILDIGCSVGVSTRSLADKFPSAKLTGLDLSPYFLAVAQFREKNSKPRVNPINWIHANGESTGLPSKSFDIVSVAYVDLSPVLFTLMKSTEPFLDEYYLTDVERVMREAGFINVTTILTDPRHRTVTATVPY